MTRPTGMRADTATRLSPEELAHLCHLVALDLAGQAPTAQAVMDVLEAGARQGSALHRRAAEGPASQRTAIVLVVSDTAPKGR